MTSDAGDDSARLRSLFDAHATGGAPRAGAADLRSRLSSELLGSPVSLPAEVPVWQHVDRGGRELQPAPYDGGVLIVHNTEPAGSSFLVYGDDGAPHARRGPALTLRRPGDDVLLVVFASDL